jgi:hypothetical protein
MCRNGARYDAGEMELLRANSSRSTRVTLPLRRRALADGYLFFRALIEPADILRLRHEVLAICTRLGWLEDGLPPSDGVVRPGIRAPDYDDPRFTQFLAEVNALPEFEALRRHPRILEVMERVFGERPEPQCLDACRLAFPGSFARTTPPHQDHFYARRSTTLWTVWLPLGDCPRGLGPIRLLPGSHKQGLRAHSDVVGGRPAIAGLASSRWASSNFHCGDALFFNSLTIHSAHQNRSRDRVRVSVDFRYQPRGRRTGLR